MLQIRPQADEDFSHLEEKSENVDLVIHANEVSLVNSHREVSCSFVYMWILQMSFDVPLKTERQLKTGGKMVV